MSKLACLMPISLLLTAVPALAQSPWGGGMTSPCLPFEPDNTIVWPETGFGLPGGFGRLVLADLNGDQAAEGVMLVGGLAVMLDTVAVHDAPSKIVFPAPAAPPVAVADIATLHGAGTVASDGTPTDGVLMTDARGLFLVTLSGTEFQASVVPDSSAWVSAAPIHVDDLNDDGDEDVVLGVSLNHRSILRLYWDGSVFTAQPTLTLNYDILDVVAVDWNKSGDDGREIVALTRRGLYVFGKNSPTGPFELQQTVTYLALTGCITRFEALGGERLAWTRKTSAGPSELLVVAKGPDVNNPVEQHGPWTLTLNLCGTSHSIEPIALMAGTYDANEDEDLLVVHEANRTALMLRNVGAAADYFDPSDSVDHDVISLAALPLGAGNVGLPAFEQLDNNGPDDIVFPVAATAKVEVFMGLAFYRAIEIPAGTQPFTSAGIIRGEDETLFAESTTSANAKLRFAFRVPAVLLDYTHIDMTIWRQPDASSAVDVNGRYRKRHPLDRTVNGLPDFPFQWIDVDPPGPLPADEIFPDGECWGSPTTKPYFYTEFRFLKIDGGTITRSRIFAGGFTLENCTDPEATSYVHLTSVGIAGSKFDLNSLFVEDIPGAGTQRELLGAFVPMSKVPYFNDEVVPNAGTLSFGATATPYPEPED